MLHMKVLERYFPVVRYSIKSALFQLLKFNAVMPS